LGTVDQPIQHVHLERAASERAVFRNSQALHPAAASELPLATARTIATGRFNSRSFVVRIRAWL